MKVPALAHLEEQTGDHYVTTITTFLLPAASSEVASGAREAHILIELGSLYESDLDGMRVQSHATSLRCTAPVAVTLAGDWAVCRTNNGVQVFPVHGPQADLPQPILTNTKDADGLVEGVYADPSWTPDGMHLSVVHAAPGECAIELYTLASAHDTVRLTATLTFAQVFDRSGRDGCSVFNPVWSPDGAWLAFTRWIAPASSHLYLLRLRGPLDHLLGHEKTAVTLAVTDAMLVDRGPTGNTAPPSWSPDATHLTFVPEGNTSIVSADITTGQRTVLLTQRVASICNVSVTPDGHHVVFVLCRPVPPDLAPPPAQLYVYTPPS